MAQTLKESIMDNLQYFQDDLDYVVNTIDDPQHAPDYAECEEILQEMKDRIPAMAASYRKTLNAIRQRMSMFEVFENIPNESIDEERELRSDYYQSVL